MAPKFHTAVDVKETNAGTEPTKPLIHSTQIYNEKGLTLIQTYSCYTGGIYYLKCLTIRFCFVYLVELIGVTVERSQP